MMNLMKWTLGNLVIAGCVLAVSPAFSQTTTTRISYDDLNLASSAGLATLDKRIDRAVTKVCGKAAIGENPDAVGDVRHCRADALRDARLQVAAVVDTFHQFAERRNGVLLASR